jgi:hypothetical protein
MSKPLSWGVPSDKVCEKLKKKDKQICELRYGKNGFNQWFTTFGTQCVKDLDLGRKIIVFESFLTTFKASTIFEGSTIPKTKSPLTNFAKLVPETL